MELLTQLIVSGLCVGAVYGVGAIGFVLIYKSSGIFNLAHGEMMMIGAFFGVTFANILGYPMWVAFLLSLLFSAVVGFGIQLISIRPLMGQPLFAILMVTVGLMFILRGISLLIWGAGTYIFPGNIFVMPNLTFDGITVASEYAVSIIIAFFLLMAIFVFFRFTRSGLSMRATADDEQLAESMGVRVGRIYALSWSLAGIAAATGGMTLGMMTSIDYMTGEVGLKVLPVVVFGGLESLFGAVIGGLVVGVVSVLSGGYLEQYFTGIKDITPYFIMLLVLLIRPYGLFGEKRIERI